jgi:hypothetical protein
MSFRCSGTGFLPAGITGLRSGTNSRSAGITFLHQRINIRPAGTTYLQSGIKCHYPGMTFRWNKKQDHRILKTFTSKGFSCFFLFSNQIL